MKKPRFILLGFVVLILITVTILLIVDFESPAIGNAFLQKVSEATGIQFEAKTFRLNLLRGLSLGEVTATGNLPGRFLQARVHRLTLEHRLLPLLMGKIRVVKVMALEPEIELVQSPVIPQRRKSGKASTAEAQAPRTSAEETSKEPVDLEIANLRIEKSLIRFRSRENDDPSVLITNLNMELSNLALNRKAGAFLRNLSGEGAFHAEEIVVGKTRTHKTKGQLYASDGTLQAKEATFTTTQGDFTVQLEMDFAQSPVDYSLLLEGNSLDTGALLASISEAGFGPGKLEFKAEGTGTDSRDIQGNGTFAISAGRLPSSPVLAIIENVLDKHTLIGAPYQATVAHFRVEGNRVLLERFLLDTKEATIDLSGSIDLDGPLALKLNLRAPRNQVRVKEIPKEVLDSMTDSSGRIAIPFQIRGNRKDPHIDLDTSAIFAQGGERTKRVVKKKLADRRKERFRTHN